MSNSYTHSTDSENDDIPKSKEIRFFEFPKSSLDDRDTVRMIQEYTRQYLISQRRKQCKHDMYCDKCGFMCTGSQYGILKVQSSTYECNMYPCVPNIGLKSKTYFIICETCNTRYNMMLMCNEYDIIIYDTHYKTMYACQDYSMVPRISINEICECVMGG